MMREYYQSLHHYHEDFDLDFKAFSNDKNVVGASKDKGLLSSDNE